MQKIGENNAKNGKTQPQTQQQYVRPKRKRTEVEYKEI